MFQVKKLFDSYAVAFLDLVPPQKYETSLMLYSQNVPEQKLTCPDLLG